LILSQKLISDYIKELYISNGKELISFKMKLLGFFFGSNDESMKDRSNVNGHEPPPITTTRNHVKTSSPENDDDTLGNDTLYDWSIAARSIDKTAEIFVESQTPCLPNEDVRAGKKKSKFGFSKGGYASSSDDDDDDDDDDEDITNANIGYCQLEDSPPRKGNHSSGDQHDINSEESTPQRRTVGSLFRRDKNHSPHKSKAEKLTKSPGNIMSRMQRKLKPISPNKGQHYPTQQLRSKPSDPVDVDSFIDEEVLNVIPSISRSSVDSKGCDAHDDSSTLGDSCSFSLQNIGNENDPHISTAFICPTSFTINTACTHPTNSSPPAILKKSITGQSDMEALHLPNTESDFTFSLHSSDLEGSDGTELLLDSIEVHYDTDSFRKQWDLDDKLPDDDEELKGTEGGKQFRKTIKNKFLGKVKSKRGSSADSITPLTGTESTISNGSSHSKPKIVDRQQSTSALSIAPLTGLEQVRSSNIGKQKADEDLVMEINRRKASEKKEVERRVLITQQRRDWEKLRKQRMLEADKRKLQQQSFDSTDDSVDGVTLNQADPSELSKHRDLLKSWVSGIGTDCVTVPNLYDQRHGTQTDLNRSDISEATPHSAVTTQAHNMKRPKSLETFGFNVDVPEDESLADTPQAAAPSTLDFSCVTCKGSERTHLAVPCMHFSFCGDCAGKLKGNQARRCPVCNEEVEKYSRVFY
jgi:hypothetical protein